MGFTERSTPINVAVLHGLMERAHVPGLAIASVRDGVMAWHGEFGVKDCDTAEPLTADTRFQAASLSKPVFAYAVLRLVEKGHLDLDRPLASYIGTTFAPDDPLLDQVTARHVLCHTTGWPNWRREGQPLRREFAPGTRFGYSGEGYNYLQLAVEYLTGQPLDRYAEGEIFAPLGMGHSSYASPQNTTEDIADSHDKAGKRRPRHNSLVPMAAASLHTTAHDFARFLAALFAPVGDDRGLSASSLAEMVRPHITAGPGIKWGLGWGLQETSTGPLFWHWGDNPGYKNFTLGSLERRQGVVILANGDGGTGLWSPLVQALFGDLQTTFDWLIAQYSYDLTRDRQGISLRPGS
jgi:CubicO group peptidase (beta-lactamase class C family)